MGVETSSVKGGPPPTGGWGVGVEDVGSAKLLVVGSPTYPHLVRKYAFSASSQNRLPRGGNVPYSGMSRASGYVWGLIRPKMHRIARASPSSAPITPDLAEPGIITRHQVNGQAVIVEAFSGNSDG